MNGSSIQAPFILPTKFNRKPIIMSWVFFLLKACTEAIKNSKHHLLKINKSYYNATLSKSWKGLKLVSSLQNSAKNKLKMFVIRCTQISF